MCTLSPHFLHFILVISYRAGIPVVAAIGSIFIEKKTPTQREFISLFIVVFGVGIAVWEGSDSKASIVGIILCFLGENKV